MRKTPWLLAEPYRFALPALESRYGDDYGVFQIPHRPTGVALRCIVSSARIGREDFGDDWAWDHVSVSLPNRCPNWPEMSFIRSVFFDDTETVMQLHVPTSQHLNVHAHCLHLWRPASIDIPLPPAEMVGIAGDNRRFLADVVAGKVAAPPSKGTGP